MKRMKPNLKSSCAAVLVALLAAGCMTVGPDYERPDLGMPDSYGKNTPADTANALTEIPDQWWTLYEDPILNGLIEKAFKNNSSIKGAVARIEEADAQMREAGAALLPTVDLAGTGSRRRVTESGVFPAFGKNPNDSNQLSFNSAVELDFWGKLSRAKEAARANYLATQFAKETVQLSIESLVVSSYLTIRSFDSQLINVKESLKISEESLALAKRREAGGIVSMLDVQQASLVRDDLLLQEQALLRQRALTEHVLNILTLEERQFGWGKC